MAAIGSLKSQPADETKAVFEAVVIRATREFGIRKIDARFEGWMDGALQASMTIWLPIRIPGLKGNPVFDLAVAI
jgi:hypothetical protein